MGKARALAQWREKHQDLIWDHGIRFEGPKQANGWPDDHRHLFRKINQIWAVRYTNYRESSSSRLSWREKRDRLTKAQEISEKAHTLRYSRVKEDTWRVIEADIMRMFERKAVCETCKNEMFMFEHEAIPADPEEVLRLQRKREQRRNCSCDESNTSMDTEPRDTEEAQPVIFLSLRSHKIKHRSEDDFANLYIPSEPDLTVGLKASPQIQHALRMNPSNIDHCPMYGTDQVLYPFLLIEAKKEAGTPGFVAIEAQTVFPLRRILLLQEDLRKAANTSFAPLAWFFAYKGEEWRLYAGTLDDKIVRIWDLWHGTVESLDGSLQLLQIVDYLYTWARDIHRTQIRQSLLALEPSLREITPFTAGSLSRSQSVLSEQISIPERQQREDATAQDRLDGESETIDWSTSITQSRASPLHSYSPHALIHQQNYCLSQTSLRHSDLLIFSFASAGFPQTEHIPLHARTKRKRATEILDLLLQSEAIAILTHSQIRDIRKMWTGEYPDEASEKSRMVESASTGDELKAVFIWCHNLCRRSDWQIERQLYCFTWGLADIQDSSSPLRGRLASALREGLGFDHYNNLYTQVFAMRNLSGKSSVSNALNEVKSGLAGFSLSNASYLSKWTEDLLIDGLQLDQNFPLQYWVCSDYFYRSTGIAALDPTSVYAAHVEDLMGFLSLPEQIDGEEAILAKKPMSWPEQCPTFCLFVLTEIEASNKVKLSQLLRNVANSRKIYGAIDERSQHRDLSCTAEDRALIRRWLRLLEQA